MTKTYRIMLRLLGLWLAGWMYLSWAAIQDDALIHLRYADNLYVHHFITYDGTHPDYGASSLLYVAILAFLRNFTASPDLARATSSAVHGLLFAAFVYAFYFRLPARARVARLAGVAMLVLLVMPSAVRWLDDGMETGIAVSFASLLAWLIHAEFVRAESDKAFSYRRYIALTLMAFLAVMLRTELVLLCGIGYLILTFRDRADGHMKPSIWQTVLGDSHLVLGGGVALCVIVATMHALLPDTAIAKSHGLAHWFNPVHDTAITLGGAFSFGIGMLLFWLLTLMLVLVLPQSGERKRSTLLANIFLPVVLGLASLRGQEIQGVRYFAWTLFFPILWNILELAHMPRSFARSSGKKSAALLSAFLLLLAIEAPFEVRAMHRVLTRRSETMREFEAQHLEVLRGRRGVASDVGYVGYFTGAKICDLAGLVNGRAAARLSSAERNLKCVQTDPDFIFGNVSQLATLTPLGDFSGWQVCGRYDFTNVRTLDTHFLAVRPAIAEEVCRATGQRQEALTGLIATGFQGPQSAPTYKILRIRYRQNYWIFHRRSLRRKASQTFE